MGAVYRALPIDLTASAASPATWFHCGNCFSYWAVLNLREVLRTSGGNAVHCGFCGVRHRLWFEDVGTSFQQLDQDAKTIQNDIDEVLE